MTSLGLFCYHISVCYKKMVCGVDVPFFFNNDCWINSKFCWLTPHRCCLKSWFCQLPPQYLWVCVRVFPPFREENPWAPEVLQKKQCPFICGLVKRCYVASHPTINRNPYHGYISTYEQGLMTIPYKENNPKSTINPIVFAHCIPMISPLSSMKITHHSIHR